jgi:hypothetical protein
MVEAVCIVTSTRFKIEAVLKDKKAFNEKSAATFEETELNFKEALYIMEKSGLIGKTSEGRIFMTQKGQDQQLRGFLISNSFPADRQFVRFSRNK